MKKAYEKIVWWIGVVSVGVIFGITLQFASAWVNPPASTDVNIGGPVNTSAVAQVKFGALGVGGLLKAFSDVIVSGTLKIIGSDGNSGSFVFKDGNQGEGKVLTSNASGVAGWEDASGGSCYVAYTTGNCGDSGICASGFNTSQNGFAGVWGACLVSEEDRSFFSPPIMAGGNNHNCPNAHAFFGALGQACLCCK
jgi:hypothetical protein